MKTKLEICTFLRGVLINKCLTKRLLEKHTEGKDGVFTAISTTITLFCSVTSCSLVVSYELFRGISCLLIGGCTVQPVGAVGGYLNYALQNYPDSSNNITLWFSSVCLLYLSASYNFVRNAGIERAKCLSNATEQNWPTCRVALGSV